MIRYQLTDEEVVRGLVKHIPRRRRISIGFLLILLGVLEAVFGAQDHSSTGAIYAGIGYAFIVLGGLIVFLLPLLHRRVYFRTVRANLIFTVPKEVSFDERGITFVSSIQKSELTWGYFRKFTEDEKYFYLHADTLGNVTLLPKSAFDETSRQEFLKCSQSVPRA